MRADEKYLYARRFPVHVGVDTAKKFHVLVARGPDGRRTKPHKVMVSRQGFDGADAQLVSLFPGIPREQMLIGPSSRAITASPSPTILHAVAIRS